jgi:hypothetical protein
MARPSSWAGRSCRRLTRLICLLATAAVLIVGSAAVPAVAQPPFGGPILPNQVFGGLVNGSTGNPTPATIRMGCFGPVRPGQTGHPLAGQTVGVFMPEAIMGTFGFTGSAADSIEAFFGPPPPAPASSGVVFHSYGVTMAIPTSLVLPCYGDGQVTFVPMPQSPTSRAAVVPVRFVGQP